MAHKGTKARLVVAHAARLQIREPLLHFFKLLKNTATNRAFEPLCAN
jgi:hypothetical protein